MRMAGRFRDQARACAQLGSPMYAGLLDRVADDIDSGGVSVEILDGHENDPGPSALALRLAGSVHRLVLSGQAPELAIFYPSVGGEWDLVAGWTAFENVLRSQPDRVREWLDQPPQTNEVGRASALMGGLLRIGESYRIPVRLFEIGSSGGLNLRADQFSYEGAWQGTSLEPWPDLRIVERLGSDVMPVDVATTEGRLTLTAYVWPDQAARLERLQGALRVAQDFPAEVRRQDAVSFVRDIELVEGRTTVLWHSVMWQYLSADDQKSVTAGVNELGASATAQMPFAHLFLEPTRRAPSSDHEFLVVLELWPTGQRRFLGTSVGHGIPTTWE